MLAKKRQVLKRVKGMGGEEREGGGGRGGGGGAVDGLYIQFSSRGNTGDREPGQIWLLSTH